jgi:hypothetical protein
MTIVFAIIGAAIGAAVLAVLTGFILLLLAEPVAQTESDYFECWKAMFLAHLSVAVAQFALVLALGSTLEFTLLLLLATLVGFAVLTVTIAYGIGATLGRAAVTALVLNIIIFLLQLAWDALLSTATTTTP